MAGTPLAVGVNWACLSTGITTPLTGTFQMQNRSLSKKADRYEARDNGGETIGGYVYNKSKTAVFELLPVSATKGNAITVVLPEVGDVFTITDATIPEFVGTSWVGDSGIELKNSNKEPAMVTVPVIAWAGMPTP